MKRTLALVMLAVALGACGPQAAAPGEDAAPHLEAPAPETEPSRNFAANNDAARGVSAQFEVATALRLPDAGSNADAQEVLTLRGGDGLVIEAQISSTVSPATQVQGQTLRALLALPVEEPQALVYRVTRETKSSAGRGICGADTSEYVVVWEPSGPGEPVLKLMGVHGGAPGAAGARACPMLEYRRS